MHHRVSLRSQVKTAKRLASPFVAIVLHLVRSHRDAHHLTWADHRHSPSFSPPAGHHRASHLTMLISRVGRREVTGARSSRTLPLTLPRVSRCRTAVLSTCANRRVATFSLCRLPLHLIFRYAQVTGVPAKPPAVVAI
jgi:hypothetical protein